MNVVVYSVDGTRLVSAGEDETVRIWDVKSATQIKIILADRGVIDSLAFLMGSKVLAALQRDGTLLLCDTGDWTVIDEFIAHEEGITKIAAEENDDFILTIGYDLKVVLWEMKIDIKGQELQGHKEVINSIAFSPDGELLVTSSDDLSVRIWNVMLGNQVSSYLGHSSEIMGANFS